MITRVDTRKIGDSELFSLSAAAKLIGCNYETLRRARNEGRLLTLRENTKVTTGSQLIAYLEAPKRIKSLKKL